MIVDKYGAKWTRQKKNIQLHLQRQTLKKV